MNSIIKNTTAKDSDPDQIVLIFDRIEMESGCLDQVVEGLSAFLVDRDTVERFAGKFIFVFHGWEADPREMYEVPEARAWFQDLTEKFPYWFVFLDRVSNAIPTAFNLLLDPAKTTIGPSGGTVLQHDGAAVSNLIGYLFEGMNDLCERLSIPQKINSRWTKEIGQCLAAYTDPQ